LAFSIGKVQSAMEIGFIEIRMVLFRSNNTHVKLYLYRNVGACLTQTRVQQLVKLVILLLLIVHVGPKLILGIDSWSGSSNIANDSSVGGGGGSASVLID
jgi:hypothetical protein